jgi:hypothetical protein
MISEYICGYINSIKNTKEKATYKGFLAFVTKVYNKAFVDGVDPLRYIEIDETSFKYLDDYKRASEMLLMALTSEDKDVDDFNYNYNKIIQGKDIKNKKNISECQGIFERIYMALVSKYGYKETDERILSFMYTGDYRFFTKKYNIRASIVDNKITPEVMALLVTGMKEKQEKERMLLRGLKKTYKKYDEEKNDYKQVRFALENAFYGNFSYFTNENNCRTALKNSVNKDEIYGLIAFKLLSFGYPIEDVYIGRKALSELYLTEIFNKESYKSIGGK